MDITGFDQQIGNPIISRFTKNIMQKAKAKGIIPKAIAPSAFSKARLQQVVAQAKAKGIIPKTPMQSAFSKARLQQVVAQAKAKGIIPKKPMLSAFSKARLQQVVAQAKAKGLAPIQKGSAFSLARLQQVAAKAKQAQIFAKQKAMIPVQKTEIKKFEQSLKNMPSGKAAFAIFDKPVTPNFIKSLTPIQRTFTRTDLPYQPVNYKQSKIVRIRNTPLNYSLNIDAVEPAVDNGSLDYYGK